MLTQDKIEKAVREAILDEFLEASQPACLSEDISSADQATVKNIAKKLLKSELDEYVVKLIKKELGTKYYEQRVADITSKVLARVFEILFTRRSTWQSKI